MTQEKKWVIEYFKAVFVAVFVLVIAVSSIKIMEEGITGLAIEDTIHSEGDRINKNDKFALNHGQPCEVGLIFKNIENLEGDRGKVHISKLDGSPVPGFPKEYDISDCNSNGCKLEINYELYGKPENLYNYTLRGRKSDSTLFLEDTNQVCPPYCGNNVCEVGEGFLEDNYCRKDCMNRDGDYLYLDNFTRYRFFEINYGKQCKGIFRFNDYTDGSLDIWEYDESGEIKRYPEVFMNTSDIDDKGVLGILPHGEGHPFYMLRFDEEIGRLYLEDTEKGCDEICVVGDKKCVTNESYMECRKDEEGYNSWGNEFFCAGQMCNVDADPDNPCVDACDHECENEGQKRCNDDGTGVETCGDFDGEDWCFEWGNLTECDDFYACEDGSCVLDCEDECNEISERECYEKNGSMIVGACDYMDDDPCLDLEVHEECDDDFTCLYDNESCLCKEDWVCGEWSDCVDGERTRTCVDDNTCGTEYEKDEFPENTSCSQGDDSENETSESEDQEVDCSEPSSYGEWNECEVTNTQWRLLKFPESCNKPDDYEERTCTYVSPRQKKEEEEVVEDTEEDLEEESGYVPLPHSIENTETERRPSLQQPVEADAEINVGWFAIIFVLVLVGGGAGAYYYFMVMGGAGSPQVEQVKKYVQGMLAQGYKPEQVKQQLISQGWDKKTVEKAFKGSSSSKTIDQRTLNYITQMRQQGYKDNQIMAELKKQGWDDKQAKQALKTKS